MGLVQSTETTSGKYLNVVQGDLREKVEEGTEKAVRRVYETSNGTKGEKWEIVYSNGISGIIEDIQLRDGDFGEQLSIHISDVGEHFYINVPSDSNYATDLLKKLPNIDLKKEVFLRPYSFTPKDSDKVKRGMTVKQGNKKIDNFYFDPNTKKVINGCPAPTGDTKSYSKTKWKAYFAQELIFLQEELLKVFPKKSDSVTKDIEVNSPEFVSPKPDTKHKPVSAEADDDDLPF